MSEEEQGREKETILVGTVDAARVLGRSDRTIRKDIKTGKLGAHKVNGAWLIELPRADVLAAGIPIPESEHLADPDTAERPEMLARAVSGTGRPPAADLGPIADVIADLTRQVGDLSASSAMWQERAQSLERQNQEIRLALTAGESKIDETEARRRVEAAAAAAKEQGREEGKAEALASIDTRPWWQKILG